MTKTSNPLIDVSFVDETAYATPLETDDIVGVVAEMAWGPCDTFTVCDKTSWAQLANPANLGRINQSYATISRLFQAGAKYIELYRLGYCASDPSLSEQVLCFLVSNTASGALKTATVPVNQVDDWASVVNLSTYAAGFRYRYAGGFPGTVTVAAYTGAKPAAVGDVPMYTIAFYLNATEAEIEGMTPTESFNVTFQRCVVSGESLFYADVLRGSSQYFTADIDYAMATTEATISGTVDFTDEYAAEGAMYRTPIIGADGVDCGITFPAAAYQAAYSQFADRDLSQATLLISTFNPNYTAAEEPDDPTTVADIYGAVSEAANSRMDSNALIGCPRSCFGSVNVADNVTAITEWFNGAGEDSMAVANSWGKFTGAIAAVERYIVNNTVFYLDGTASWAGAICNIAANLSNRNQLPSYKAYGSTDAVLVKTLDFASVVSLMDNYGIGSIYKAATGNYIFNIRSRYELQTSYFGKLNVMRVTAAVLGWLLDDVENVIHTGVVSDASDRLTFQEQCNKKLGQMIARGELKNESVVNCGDDINTDALTNGGECLNVQCFLYFKKLAERVSISIIASDTTTSVTLAQE